MQDFTFQLFAMHLSLIDLILDAAEDAMIEDLWIIIDHQSEVLDFFLLGVWVGVKFVERESVGKYFFLEGFYNFGDDLSDFGLHLKPLELFEHSLFIVH